MTVSNDTLPAGADTAAAITNLTGWDGLDEFADKLWLDFGQSGQPLILKAFAEIPRLTLFRMENWYRDPKTGVAFHADDKIEELVTTGNVVCPHIGIWEEQWYHVYPKPDAAPGELWVIRLTR